MTDDQDPTGMSHLLAGLKESGPMPDDLNDRIRASLEQEQAARGKTPDASTDGDDTGFWSEVDSEDRGSTRRRGHTGRWVLGLAVAVVVALGIGGIVALGSDEPDQKADGPQASAPASEGEGEPTSSSQESASSSSSAGTPSQVPAFAITDTDTDYSRANLPAKAAELEADPLSAPELEDPGRLDGMDTAAAASDCLARIGQPELLPIVIDVATFDGRDGLLLVAEEAPEGKVRAWAVTTGCEPIWDQAFSIPQG